MKSNNYDLQVNSAYASNTVVDTGRASDVLTDFVETITPGSDGHYGSNGATAPDGSIAAFVNNDSSGTVTLSNDLTADGTQTAPTFVAGDTYTLQLEVGINPTNANQAYDQIGNISFGLTANGTAVGTQATVASGSITPTYVDDAPQVTFEDVTYTFTATSAVAGDAIGIQINDAQDGASQPEFSDLRLTEVPEPTTWAMLLGSFALLAFGLRLRALRSL